MRISDRITHLTDDPRGGWEIWERTQAMKARGEAVADLTVGEHDTPTDRRILDALHAAAVAGATRYTPIPGTRALREAVALRVETRTGVKTRAENVQITPGGQAALFAAHMLACDPGDRALHIDPYYATYPGTIRATGAVALAVGARPEDGFQPRADAIDGVAEGARSLLINSPNNPTGAVYSRATLEGLAEVAAARDLWLISDEVYDTQVWDGAHLSPRALPGMAERTLVVGSMSKSHAMTGSRIGWVVGPEEAIGALSHLATHTTYGVSGFVQAAALHALGLGADFEAGIAAPFGRRRALALERVARSQVVRAVPAAGAMYVMLDIRATGLSGRDFAAGLLDAEQVAVMPGESFGQAAAGHVRVALTLGDEALAAALERLVAHAEALAA